MALFAPRGTVTENWFPGLFVVSNVCHAFEKLPLGGLVINTPPALSPPTAQVMVVFAGNPGAGVHV